MSTGACSASGSLASASLIAASALSASLLWIAEYASLNFSLADFSHALSASVADSNKTESLLIIRLPETIASSFYSYAHERASLTSNRTDLPYAREDTMRKTIRPKPYPMQAQTQESRRRRRDTTQATISPGQNQPQALTSCPRAHTFLRGLTVNERLPSNHV